MKCTENEAKPTDDLLSPIVNNNKLNVEDVKISDFVLILVFLGVLYE